MRDFTCVLVDRLLKEGAISTNEAVAVAAGIANFDGTPQSVVRVFDAWTDVLKGNG